MKFSSVVYYRCYIFLQLLVGGGGLFLHPLNLGLPHVLLTNRMWEKLYCVTSKPRPTTFTDPLLEPCNHVTKPRLACERAYMK